jgi:hypothetical protein
VSLKTSDLLASPEALAASIGTTFDPSDPKLLKDLEIASAWFRSESHQHISAVAADEQELHGNWTHRLWLPQRPVTDLVSIKIRRYGQIVYTTATVNVFSVSRRGLVLSGWDWGGPEATIVAVYDHGYDEIPDDVEAAVLSRAKRLFTAPRDSSVASRQIGSAQTSYFESGGTPAIGVTDFEAKVVWKYAQVEVW